MDLRDKIILITGASKGIGREISFALAAEGSHIILTSRTASLLEEIKDKIIQAGQKATVIPADLAVDSDISALFERINDRFGKLDVLVNNAGIGIFGKLKDFSMEDFDRIIRINLRAVYLCCQNALKLMIPGSSGHIINIASAVGVKGYPDQSAYGASKHGVMGLTKALAEEIREHKINVSAILPGGVDTEFVSKARPDLDSSVLIPPSDIAKTIIYILTLSDRSMVDMIYIRRRNSKPF
jgi:3-oxoacyl-[acyl-carrier protein] reductase